jgi:hypothetical protein
MTTAPNAGLLAFLLATACVGSPSYEGRLCAEGNQCPTGFGCDGNHLCRRLCARDGDCGSGEVCTEGLCMPGPSNGSGDPIDPPPGTDPGAMTSNDPATPTDSDAGASDDASPSITVLPGEDASTMSGSDAAASDATAPDATIDPSTYQHKVTCTVFDDGYTNPSANADAIYIAGPGQACIPGGATGICRRWFGRCVAEPAPDGHTHQVFFLSFDDGYTNMTGGSDAILMSAAFSACVPGGANGVCRRWFGRGYTSVTENHSHPVWCEAFDDGYANPTGMSDAVLWNGTQSCVPGGANGVCRRWFGRCVTH